MHALVWPHQLLRAAIAIAPRGLLRGARALTIGLALVVGLLACRGRPAAELLAVVDVAPHHFEVGNEIEVLGSDLPSGSVSYASVRFHGTLHRAGRAPEPLDELVVEGARPSPDRVTFVFTEELQRAFCGEGDDAQHTTFVGDVVVRFDATVEGSAGVQGTVHDIVIDVRAPTVRRAVSDERDARARGAHAFLGVETTEPVLGQEGLRIDTVRPHSPAARAGLVDGDVLLRFDHVTLLSRTDLIPRRGSRHIDAVIVREDRELARTFDVTGFEREPVPHDVLAALLIVGLPTVLLLLLISPFGVLIAWIERRLLLQRATPRGRTGALGALRGWWSSFLALVIPQRGGRHAELATLAVFIGVTASFVLLPLGKRLLSADIDVGLLYVVAFTSLVVIGLLTAGGAHVRWTPWTALRGAIHLCTTQIPAITAVACVVWMSGSLRMDDVIATQTAHGDGWLGHGGWPWAWFVFRHPGTFTLFCLFFATATLDGHRDARGLPSAEIQQGRAHAPVRQVLFAFADWAHVFVSCGLATAVFLGGWLVPGLDPEVQAGHLGWQLLGTLIYLVKAWGLVLAVIAIRKVLPRLVASQLTKLTWLAAIPLATVAAAATVVWHLGTRPSASGHIAVSPSVAVAVAAFTCMAFAAVIAHLVARVRHGLRERTPLQLNPFL